jgi:hypothetical protein
MGNGPSQDELEKVLRLTFYHFNTDTLLQPNCYKICEEMPCTSISVSSGGSDLVYDWHSKTYLRFYSRRLLEIALNLKFWPFWLYANAFDGDVCCERCSMKIEFLQRYFD